MKYDNNDREKKKKEEKPLTISPTNSERRSSCLTIHKQFNIQQKPKPETTVWKQPQGKEKKRRTGKKPDESRRIGFIRT